MAAVAAVSDETSPIELVVVGIAEDRGPLQLHNLTIAHYQQQGMAPKDSDLSIQVESFCLTLKQLGVEVLRPKNINGVLQIFVRDLGFVIGDTFIWCNPKKEKRRLEQNGLRTVIDQLEGIKTVSPPDGVTIEGGDIVLLGGRVLVGVGSDPGRGRTGRDAVEFLEKTFPQIEIIPIEIKASDSIGDNPLEHVLHLDCAFQPIGTERAIFFERGFAGRPDPIFDLIGDKRLIHVSAEEMLHLWPNLFSVSPGTVVSAPSFARLNEELRSLGMTVLEVPYEEVAKLGGLFRCSTLPLRRGPSE